MTGIRVLVCGGRDYRDQERVFLELDLIAAECGISLIIEGGQRTYDKSGAIIGGADFFASRWSWERLVEEPMTIKANWKAHGLAAGPIRNQRMIDEGKPDLVIAFPGGRGTADMVARARAAGIEVVEVGE